MSEILTNLWLNIDNLSYMEKDRVQISQDDIELLAKARRNLIVQPGICLLLTIGFSRYRHKLWRTTKNYFLGDRTMKRKLKVVDNIGGDKASSFKSAATDTPISEEVKIEYRYSNSNNYEDSNKIALSQSRKLSARRKSSQNEEFMNISRIEPTVSEEHLSFTHKYINSVRRFALLKKLVNKYTKKDSVYHRGENFLLGSKLIYLPFIILLFLSFYDLILTYAGLYIKYQPLIDEYYGQTTKDTPKVKH